MKTALIIEDEYPARLRMHQLLEAHTETIAILGEADTGKKAIALIEAQKPDVIFLDIQLPDMTGFDVLKKISYQPSIIFTTAYSEYALKAFENYSIDYLVKPIEKERFDQSIQKLKHWDQKNKVDEQLVEHLLQAMKKPKMVQSLPIKKKDKIILVDFEQIVFFKAEDKYVNVHMNNGTEHLLSKSLSALADTLPEQFIRLHRSYIVNRKFVSEIQKYFKGKFILQLSDNNGSKITTGETYTDIVKKTFSL